MISAVKSKNSVGRNLTEGPIFSNLLSFAVPIVLANIVQQLYSMVDLAVIGQFAGNAGTSGVSVGSEIADVIFPVAVGFSSAGQIYIAQQFGAGKEQQVKKIVGTLMTFMLLLSVVFTVGIIVLADPLLSMLNCPSESLGQARNYMIITALGTPAVFGYNAVSSILRGMGESKRPLFFVIIAASINIVLDLFLVIVIPLEAAGTAIATAASQYGSFLAACWFMWKKREKFGFQLKLSYFKIDKTTLWILFKLGIPLVIRSFLVRVSMLWVNAMVNSYNDIVVSNTNYVGAKIQKLLEMFMISMDAAAAAMVGQNLGARKLERSKKIILCAFSMTLTFAAAASLLCIFLPRQVFSLFTQDPAVMELGAVYMRIMIVQLFASATVDAFQAMVTGSGFVSLGFAVGLLDGVICKVCLSLFFIYVMNMGYLGLFRGVACSRVLPALIYAAYFISGKWKTRKLL